MVCSRYIYSARGRVSIWDLFLAYALSRPRERLVCTIRMCVCTEGSRSLARVRLLLLETLGCTNARGLCILGGVNAPACAPCILQGSTCSQQRRKRESSCKALNCNFLDPLIAQERERRSIVVVVVVVAML